LHPKFTKLSLTPPPTPHTQTQLWQNCIMKFACGAEIFICVHMRLMTVAPDPTPILTSLCCNPIYFFFAIIPSLEFKTATLYYFSSSLTAENFQYVARYFQVFVMFLQQLLYTKYKGCK
jgi:hypothetical protein